MRRIALLTIPLLLVLGLAPLTADTSEDAHELTIPTITLVESSDDMMMASKDMMMMDVQHIHDMGTADDMADDVTHTHDTQTHTHDMGTADDMTDDVTHYHGEYRHTHGEEDMLNAPGHMHGFHTHVVGEVDSAENAETDDHMHYHLGGGFVDDHTHASFQAGPMVKFKGSSTLTFGMNLGTNATGFKNSAEADLTVTIIPKQTHKRNSEEMAMDTNDLYAYIELKDLKWEANKKASFTTAPAITTKLFIGPFSVTTYSQPKIDIDYVDTNDKEKEGQPGYPDFDDIATEYIGTGGLTLGYKIAPVELSLGVLSKTDWTRDTTVPKHIHTHDQGTTVTTDDIVHQHNEYIRHEDLDATELALDCDLAAYELKTEEKCYPYTRVERNEANAYAFHGTVKLDIGANAKLEAAVAYGHAYAPRPIGIGAKATFDLGDIDPHIAFDGQIPEGDADILWDVGAGLKWDISPTDDKSYFMTELMMSAPGGGADSVLGMSATLKEGDADEGALAGLGASLRLDLTDLTGESGKWGVTAAAHYKVEGIKPFFMVKFSNATDAKTAFKAGLELSMVDYLTTTLMYESKDITGGTDKGDVTAALKITY